MFHTMVKQKHEWSPGAILDLRIAAKLKDWTQRDCAEFVGVSVRQWNNWERGERTPSTPAAKMLDQLAKKVNFSKF